MQKGEEWLISQAIEKNFITFEEAEEAKRLQQEYLEKDQDVSLSVILLRNRFLTKQQFDILKKLYRTNHGTTEGRSFSGELNTPEQSCDSKSESSVLETFDRYKFIRKIGKGNFGEVYLVEDPEWNRQFALKVLSSQYNSDDLMIKRFQREVQAASQLRHENIVRLYEVGKYQGQHFFTMEYIEGQSLADYIDEQYRIPARQAVQIISKIVDAIDYAHKNNIIHRDIKPANIILDKNLHPYLADFGLARPLHGGTKLSHTGNILGTPAYMSPEQAQENDTVDNRSDIYSLGATLYDMITGQVPFPGENLMDVLYKVSYEDPTIPSKINDRVSQDLENICLKCLAKSPEERYQTATELQEDLQRFLEGAAVKAEKPKFSWRKWSKNNKVLLSVAASVAIMIVVVVAWSYFVKMQHTQQLLQEVQKIIEAPQIENKGNSEEYIAELSKRILELQQAHRLVPNNFDVVKELYRNEQIRGEIALHEKNYILSKLSYEHCLTLAQSIYKEKIQDAQEKIKSVEKSQNQEVEILQEIMFSVEKQIGDRRIDDFGYDVIDEYAMDIAKLRGDNIIRELLKFLKTGSSWQRLITINALGKIGKTNIDDCDIVQLLINKSNTETNISEQENHEIIWALTRLAQNLTYKEVFRIRWKVGQESDLWKRTLFAFENLLQKLELDTADTHNEMGILFCEKEMWQEAKVEFDRALALAPGHEAIHNNRALVYCYLEKPQEALDDIRFCMEKYRNNPQYNNNLGAINFFLFQIYTRASEHEKALQFRDAAEKFYKKSHGLDPNKAIPCINISATEFSKLSAMGIVEGFNWRKKAQKINSAFSQICQRIQDNNTRNIKSEEFFQQMKKELARYKPFYYYFPVDDYGNKFPK